MSRIIDHVYVSQKGIEWVEQAVEASAEVSLAAVSAAEEDQAVVFVEGVREEALITVVREMAILADMVVQAEVAS